MPIYEYECSDCIHYFDEFEGRYTEHYGDVRQEEPADDMGFGSYDEDSDDDDFI